MRRGVIAALLAALLSGGLAIDVSPAAASLPAYGGLMAFPTIHGPSDPEEFSWEVTLWEGEELRPLSETEAAVYYEGGLQIVVIQAAPAHDAEGTRVPTTLAVTGENIVTLTVHHRDGNPAAGGAPFVYPVENGEPFVRGPSTVIVGPPDEQELREAQERRERIAREQREAAEASRCHVPALRGATLNGARRRLRRANCRLGVILTGHDVTARTGRVVEQAQPRGRSLPAHARVGIRLG